MSWACCALVAADLMSKILLSIFKIDFLLICCGFVVHLVQKIGNNSNEWNVDFSVKAPSRSTLQAAPRSSLSSPAVTSYYCDCGCCCCCRDDVVTMAMESVIVERHVARRAGTLQLRTCRVQSQLHESWDESRTGRHWSRSNRDTERLPRRHQVCTRRRRKTGSLYTVAVLRGPPNSGGSSPNKSEPFKRLKSAKRQCMPKLAYRRRAVAAIMGDHGVIWPPHFLAVWGSICAWTPTFYRYADCSGCMQTAYRLCLSSSTNPWNI